MSDLKTLACDLIEIDRQLDAAKHTITMLNKQRAAVDAQLLDLMIEEGLKTFELDDGTKLAATTIINGKRTDDVALGKYLIETGENGIAKYQIAPSMLDDPTIRDAIQNARPGEVATVIHSSTFGSWIRNLPGLDPLDPKTWPPGVEISTFSTVKVKAPKSNGKSPDVESDVNL